MDQVRGLPEAANAPIYVTGHSLGATEAQVACQFLGTGCAGGETWGGTGIPGNVDPGPTTLVNHVQYGDPVGNFSTDPGGPLLGVVPANMRHYGQTQMEGAPSDANALRIVNAQVLASIQAPESGDYFGAASGTSGALFVSAVTAVAGNLHFHDLTAYGISSTGIPAPFQGTSAEFAAEGAALFLRTYGLALGAAGDQNMQNATFGSNGSVISGDLTIGFSNSSSQVTLTQAASVTDLSGATRLGGVATILLDNVVGTSISIAHAIGSVGSVVLAGDIFNVSASNATVTVSAGGTASVSGSSNSIGAGAGSTISTAGNTDTITAGAGATISVNAGTGNVVFASGSTINQGTGTRVDMVGSSDTINLATGAYVGLIGGTDLNVVGTGAIIATTPNTSFKVFGGPNGDDIYLAPGDHLGLMGGAHYNVMGNGAWITATANTGFDLAGGNDTIELGTGDYLGLIGGAGYRVSGTGVHVATAENTSFNLDGGNDRIDLATGDYLGLLGGTGYQVGGTGATIATWADTGFSLSGGNDKVILGTGAHLDLLGGAGYAVTGTSAFIQTLGNTSLSLDGGYDAVSLTGAAGSDTLNLIGGTGYAVSAAGQTIELNDNNATVAITGTNTVNIQTGSLYTIYGSGNQIVALANNQNDTFIGSNNTLTATGANDIFGFNGQNEVANLTGGTINLDANGVSITVNGNGNTVNAGATTGDLVGFTGHGEIAYANGSTINLNENGDDVVIHGSGNTIATAWSGNAITLADANSTATLVGSYASVTGNAGGDVIGFLGQNNTVTLSSGTINFDASSEILTVNGTGNQISAGSWTNDRLILGTSSTTDTIYIQSGRVELAGTDDHITVVGSNDIVDALGNAHNTIGFLGINENANISNGQVYVNSSLSSVTVHGNSDYVSAADHSVVGIDGDLNSVFLSNGIINIIDEGVKIGILGSYDVIHANNDIIGINGFQPWSSSSAFDSNKYVGYSPSASFSSGSSNFGSLHFGFFSSSNGGTGAIALLAWQG